MKVSPGLPPRKTEEWVKSFMHAQLDRLIELYEWGAELPLSQHGGWQGPDAGSGEIVITIRAARP